MVSSGAIFHGSAGDVWMADGAHCRWCMVGTIEGIKAGSMEVHGSHCS
jgi:hypothetical protein